jgi:hypothetical protein
MATRFIGDARITIRFDGYSPPRMYYSGRVTVGRVAWEFDDIGLSEYVHKGAADSPEAFDAVAAAAVSFGSYWTTHNRGDDVPEWAPTPEVADAISDAVGMAQDEEGRGLYAVRRAKNGPIHWAS